MTKGSAKSTDTCEAILYRELEDSRDHELLDDETAVAERLLKRRLELVDAYGEIDAKLSPALHAPTAFFRAVMSTTASWNPEQIALARDEKKRLEEINREISVVADRLANLLAERTRIGNESAFHCKTHRSVAKVIEAAAGSNVLFKTYVRGPLRALRGEFLHRYWPSIDEFVRELARDARDTELEADDLIAAAATNGPRKALSSYFEALVAAVEDNKNENGGFIPSNFSLTDNSLASLANCALDLAPEDMVDGAYVKRFRQRKRQRAVTQPQRAP